MTDTIKLIFGSDFHFGKHRMDQYEMADAFASTIFPLLEETDIFCINGDFFDTLVIFDKPAFDPIYDLILTLFHLCERHQITLRVLQGTFDHDRHQCKRFNTFYKNGGFTFNFKFFDSIDFETIKIRDRELRFFYVPDSLPFKSSDDIVQVINDKRQELGWDYVDYGCMHGFFDFTFPEKVKKDNIVVFRENQFDFVRKLIDVGHVHQHRIKGKVISNGSFDRLSSGDEDPKGCIQVIDHPTYYTARFIENTKAAIFDTLVFSDKETTESIVDKVTRHLNSLNTKRQISLRFIIDSNEHFDALKTWMKQHHPDITISRKKTSDKINVPVSLDTVVLRKTTEEIIVPNRKTISTFVKALIPVDLDLSIDEIDQFLNTKDE